MTSFDATTSGDGGSSAPNGGVLSAMKAARSMYRLEDMEIKSALGTGTFGRVVLVQHTPTDEYFALKMLNITEVIKLKQVEHVKDEKEVLSAVSHPFIVNMLWTDHDSRYLYMLFEYLCGGELFTYLRNAGQFADSTCLFYAAEITSALDYLHSMSIVYRDLKPENLLLDKEGHLKLTDFGFSKKLDDRTWTLCGTPEYLAPEIIQNKGHNKAVDWWALGILIYEMLVGYPPFFDDNPFKIYDRILEGKISWSKHTDPVAKDLIKKLLVQDRTRRLGNMKNGAADVKSHRWFRKVNWDDVYNRKLDPPIVPRVRHHGDARNFYDYPEQNWQKWYELQEDPGCPPSDGLSFADQSSRDLAPPPVPENSVNWSTSSSSFSGSRPPQGTSNSDLRIFEDF